MNKKELVAIQIIAKKMNWQQKPVEYVIKMVNQMVTNQQNFELEVVGECDNNSDTLLSIAQCRVKTIKSII